MFKSVAYIPIDYRFFLFKKKKKNITLKQNTCICEFINTHVYDI